MKLAEVYANYCGVKLPKEPLKPYRSFFPIVGNYITIHNGSGMDSKNYDYYSEVLEILIKRLEGVRFVQIGTVAEKLLPYCEDLRGKTNLSQCSYVVENALLHIGNDSVWMHVAGLLDIPCVGLYGPTLSEVCAPFYKNPASQFLNSNRNGNRATHSVVENPKTINLIKPEEVANAALSILGVKETTQKTVYIGKNYTNPIIDVIPDHILPDQLFQNNLINIRYDLGGEEFFIFKNTESRFCNLVTKKRVSNQILQALKGRLKALIFKVEEIEDLDIDFIREVAQLNIEYSVVTEIETLLPELKFKLLSLNPPKKIVRPEALQEIPENGYFKSSKILASSGNFFLSEWHLDAKLPMFNLSENLAELPKTQSELFWNDMNNYMIFTL
jgi:hypothetical protein